MRWSDCSLVIWRRAARVKTYAPISPARATSSCGSSWRARCWKQWPGILLRSGGDTLSSLFPLFLKLEGKSCLVVGAGLIGLEKVDTLLRCGVRLRVVAPNAVAKIQDLS